jgi:hypothetical protein
MTKKAPLLIRQKRDESGGSFIKSLRNSIVTKCGLYLVLEKN